MIGKSDRETIDLLNTAYGGARSAIGEFGSVPKDGAYEHNWSDAVKPLIGEGEDVDKSMAIINQALAQSGITDKQAGVVNGIVEGFVEAGILTPPQDPNEILATLAPGDFQGSDAEKLAAASERVGEAEKWIDLHSEKHELSEDQKTELQVLTASPGGLAALDHFRKLLAGGQGAGLGGAGGGVKETEDTLNERLADPRNDFGGGKYDPSFAAETQRRFKAFYGD